MPKPFEQVYSDEQRDAITHAVIDRGIRPYRRVIELAAAGELGVDAFTIRAPSVIGTMVATEKRHRAGRNTGQLSQAPPRDAIEALRKRLINAADSMLSKLERQIAKDADRADPERLRQIIRCVREAAALPAPGDAPPRAPGSKAGAPRAEGETKGGLAGSILTAHRGAGTTPAPDLPPHQDEHTEGRDATRDATENDASTETHKATDPGLLVRERAEAAGVAGWDGLV